MKCLILAAGKGSRLRQRGDSKPLISVLGIPHIERTIRSAIEAGVHEFYVVSGCHGEQVRRFLDDLALRGGQLLGTALRTAQGTPDHLEAELVRLGNALAATPDNVTLQAEYDSVLHQLSNAPNPGLAQHIFDTFGLLALDPDLPLMALSGGQQTRLKLARLCVGDPQLVLLDEPTNHLDIDMLTWFEDWLESFAGAALVVSHDRVFLDHVTAVGDTNIQTGAGQDRIAIIDSLFAGKLSLDAGNGAVSNLKCNRGSKLGPRKLV